MPFIPGEILHVYNRGNNKQPIFFNERNYRLFVNKAGKHVGAVSDILAYCLMPNHFHFLLHVNDLSCKPKRVGSLMSAELQNGFRMLQSSYASAINKEFGRTGSLFQQNTKYKLLEDELYTETCFHYIHQNPLKAGLVEKLENWEYSSFMEYTSSACEKMCNQELLFEILNLSTRNFYEVSYRAIKEDLLENIF